MGNVRGSVGVWRLSRPIFWRSIRMLPEFRRWTERVAAAGGMSWRVRYVRKSTESTERQVASHAQQIEAADRH